MRVSTKTPHYPKGNVVFSCHRFTITQNLNQSGLLECLVDAVFVHGFEGLCRDSNGDGLADLRHEEAPLLEVHLTAAFAGWVKLSRARAV